MEQKHSTSQANEEDLTESEKKEKEENIRQILEELLESEKNYVRDLNQVQGIAVIMISYMRSTRYAVTTSSP